MLKSRICLLFVLLCAFFGITKAQSNNKLLRNYLDSCSNYININRPDLVVQYNMKAENLANKDKDVPYETNFLIQYNYIWAFGAIQNNELKRTHILKLIALLDQHKEDTPSHFHRYQNALGDLAASFHITADLDSAIKYYEYAILLALEFKDTIYIASTLNNMGYYTANNDNWTLAKSYFDKAIQTLNQSSKHDSILYCSIRDNIADYFFNKGDSAQAIRIVEENMQYLLPKKESKEKLIRWGNKLLDCYINNHEYQKADSLISIIQNIISKEESSVSYGQNKQLIGKKMIVLQQLNELEEIKRIQEKYTLFLENYSAFLDQQNKTLSDLLLDYKTSITKEEMALAKQEAEYAKKNALRNRAFLIVIAVISILIIVLLVLNYKRKIALEHRDNELNIKQLEIERLEKNKIRFELNHKTKDFSKLLMQSTLQEDWSKYLIDKLQSIKRLKEENAKIELRDLILELKQKAGMYEKIHEMQKGMEKSNTRFFFALDSRYPSLTKAEKETCGLIRMNMQSKEIALIRNIDPSSVRKLRQRIRTKVSLDPNEDLYQFIQSI